jgi:DNA-directed RNA polymerase subunit RPC12/RpoP
MQKEKSKKPAIKNGAVVACPFCGSTRTQQETDFGTTLAYAQFYCLACRTPFEWIKWEEKISKPDLPAFFSEKNGNA